jgi:hypothetical protein
MKCKYNDCGWCYAPENVETNATRGGCFEPEYCPYTKQMTEEPSDTEILEFLLNQFQSHSLKMNGQHSYRFMNDGFPMNRAKGPSARDAIIVAMREQEESTRKFKEKYPEWSGE